MKNKKPNLITISSNSTCENQKNKPTKKDLSPLSFVDVFTPNYTPSSPSGQSINNTTFFNLDVKGKKETKETKTLKDTLKNFKRFEVDQNGKTFGSNTQKTTTPIPDFAASYATQLPKSIKEKPVINKKGFSFKSLFCCFKPPTETISK